MIRLAISVEGETEEAFVNNILREHLLARSVDPIPVLLYGDVTVERLDSEMAKLVWNFDHVTSLVDFYGFRDKGNVTRRELEQTIFETIDRDIGRNWDQSRAFPYVQQYEFEGLLFSDVTAFASAIDLPNQSVVELRNIRSHFQTPEDINDNRDTAPSKRIEKVMPRYNKVVHGSLLAEATGLDTIRSECPRFNTWVERLESLV